MAAMLLLPAAAVTVQVQPDGRQASRLATGRSASVSVSGVMARGRVISVSNVAGAAVARADSGYRDPIASSKLRFVTEFCGFGDN